MSWVMRARPRRLCTSLGLTCSIIAIIILAAGQLDYNTLSASEEWCINCTDTWWSGSKTEDTTRTLTRLNILLAAYTRSGSTFVGEIFNNHPDVFYMFEPLHILQLAPQPIRKCLTGEAVPGLMNALLNCDVRWRQCGINMSDIIKFQQRGGYVNYKIRRGIALVKDLGCYVSDDEERFERCANVTATVSAEQFFHSCERRKIHASKILMLRMKLAPNTTLKQLLIEDPTLKIIHLLRDPRGIINSKVYKWHWYNDKSILSRAKQHCKKVLKDVSLGLKLDQEFPNRFLTVKYEDIADHPFKETRELFAKLGLSYNDQVHQYLTDNTVAKNRTTKEKSFFTGGRNSSDVAHQWIATMNPASIAIVEQECRTLMKTVGYAMSVS